ncbi:hypothetical protein RhiirA4_476180 [Rhizophagus irregularis]|uniref:Uncharacterized protein n=1 Tax=Rhizophagus irregularis TaxID=588596 RepID=A0A2I1HB50_9GLOM|nr:hypothetical protein RhiirA4_476180 [Rhizophagus irregularis]
MIYEVIIGLPPYHNLSQINKQIKEAEEINNILSASGISSTSLSYEIHPEAAYTSRLLNFNNNLPEPKNSDDYYNN